MNASDDPGWVPALRPWWKLLLPWFVLANDGPSLHSLRHRYVHAGILLVELCFGLQWVFDGQPRSISPILWIVVAAVAAWSIGASAFAASAAGLAR